MKKIILFIDSLGSGGAQRQVANVAVLLKKAGYAPEVLVYQDIPFYKPLLDQNGIPVTLVEAKGSLRRILKIRRYLNRSGASAVLSFLETPGFIACVSKMGHKKWKLVTSERSAKLSTFTTKRNRFFNWFERFSDAKVGNSRNAINLWEQHYPQWKDKYSVIYNYIRIPEEFTEHPHEYRRNGKLTLTVAASYQELKNPLGVIEAVRLLSAEERAMLSLHWYGKAEVTTGNTEIYDRARALVEEYGLSDTITLHEETQELYRIVAESDVLGLFSTVEGLPNTVCEAMVIGRPIIMSRVSDYDVLVDGNGILCDPHSVESIKEALSSILSLSTEELARMGKRSKEKAEALFSATTITKQWSKLIQSLIEGK